MEPGSQRARCAFLTLAALALPMLAEAAGEGPGLFAHPGEGPRAAGSLLIVLALVLLNGAFAMGETALQVLRPSRVDQLLDEGRRGASAVKRLLDNPSRYLATTQVGITLLGYAGAAASAVLVGPLLGDWLTLLLKLPQLWSDVAAVALVTFLVAGVAMAVGELAPKAAALRAPDVWALRLAGFLEVCAVLFAPLTFIALALSRLLVPGAKFETPMVTREEFEKIAETSGKSGEIDDTEARIITNVIDLSEKLVRAVMTPRTDMTAVAVDASVEEVLDAIISSGHTRIPVFDGTTDNIVGVIHAKDLLPLFMADKSRIDLRHVMRPPFFVVETRKVGELLQEMRRKSRHLAIVQDEYAGTEGLVTIEDLLEEIVGNIRDEHDRDEPELFLLSGGESLVDGRMSLDEVNERLGLELPTRDYDTIGGLVFGLLGHEPGVGESVAYESSLFVVEAIDGRRIKTVRIKKSPPASAGGSD